MRSWQTIEPAIDFAAPRHSPSPHFDRVDALPCRAVVWQGPERMERSEKSSRATRAQAQQARPAAGGGSGSAARRSRATSATSATTHHRLVIGDELAGRRRRGQPQGGEEFDSTRVTVDPLSGCGECRCAKQSSTNLSTSTSSSASRRPAPSPSWCACRAADARVLPDDTSFRTSALVEPLADGVHAVRLRVVRAGPSSARWRSVVGRSGWSRCRPRCSPGVDEVAALLEPRPEQRQARRRPRARLT